MKGLVSTAVTGVAVAGAALAGCTQRTLSITSDPPGAVVWVNDVEVGRTPVETDFVHFGTYDVRLRLEGHQPLATTGYAGAPLHEQPGIDLVTLPMPLQARVEWHYVLTPLAEASGQEEAERAVVERGQKFREASGISGKK